MTAEPQDHLKSAKDYPATVEFKTSNGKLVLPHFSKINGGALRKARKSTDQLDQFFILIEEFCGDPSPELDALDKLPLPELGEVFMQWTQGATPGESPSSES